MTRWNLEIPEETDRIVRSYIAQSGGTDGDLSKFVEKAVRKEIFRETIKTVQERNASADQEALLKTVEEAVDWARASRS